MVIMGRFSERFLILRIRVVLWRADRERTRTLLREFGEFVDIGGGADIDAVLDLEGSSVYTDERAILAGLRLAAIMRCQSR
ncbi:hypothetical protein ACFWAD_06820 [Rhodococcus sp. NPDC059969]|uniref:hypothetical protein n=1 Tax=Rhodococcus sp. NPDC059969 TaxID=3347018 RepID=UPI0036703F42